MRVPRLFAALLLLAAGPAGAQVAPQTTYLFPAGARRGTSVEVRIGGRNLPPRGSLWLSGGDVRAAAELRDGAARIEVDDRARVGEREWRVLGPQGVSIPRPFVISDLPEMLEAEPNSAPDLAQVVSLPVVINGQLDPAEDRDQFCFTASAGEVITLEVEARRIASPADVTLTVMDPSGGILATEDRRGDRDPRLTFRATRAGVYRLVVNQYDYTGGPERVYRLTVTRGPRLAFAFPPGGRRGESVPLMLYAAAPGGAVRAASTASARLDAPLQPLQEVAVRLGEGEEQRLRLAVDELPERLEFEPNDATAQAVTLPCILNGRLGRRGDRDEFRFTGRKGEALVCEITARALGSPADTVLTLLDAAGKELRSNDDQGPLVVDARVEATLPADGEYRVRVAEAMSASRGGLDFFYRLRISAPRPHLRPRAAADAVTLLPGGEQKLAVTIERREGLAGPVTLRAEGLPAGITAEPVTTTAGQAEMLFRATGAPAAGPFRIIAQSADEGVSAWTATATFPAVIVNNTPVASRVTETLFVCVARPAPFALSVVERAIPAGRGTTVRIPVAVRREPGYHGPIRLELADAPAGFTALPAQAPPGADVAHAAGGGPLEVNLNSVQRLTIRGAAARAQAGDPTLLFHIADKQALVLVQSQQLSLTPAVDSVAVARGGAAVLELTVRRPPGQAAPVTVTLEPSAGFIGVTAVAVTLTAHATTARLTLRADASAGLTGFDDRVRIRATTGRDGYPVIADAFVRVALLPAGSSGADQTRR